ncbi:MAG: hypothetical protein KDD25_06400, partial [Bdellovibrionales bacterium]|nr:hypothetical protein [Bdellovibrionales bacterium]
MLLCLLAVVGCGSPNGTTTSSNEKSNPPSDGANPPPLTDPSCSNPNPDIKVDCLPVVDIKEVQKKTDEYDYRDSYSDPSFPSSMNKDQYRSPQKLIEIGKLDPETRVANNFVLREFLSEVKGSYGLTLPILTSSAQLIRDLIGKPLRVNSGYRSPGYNAGVPGSAKWSRHMYGDAFDIASSVTLTTLKNRCEQLGAG